MNSRPVVAVRPLAPLAALALLAGCATVPGQDRLAERDPLEKVNRGLWNVNMTADKVIVKPITVVYRTVTPRPARTGIANFFENITEPWSFVNNMLQGKPKRAMRNLGRFLLNTTAGIGGLLDPASKSGIRPAPEDFGQTMAVWGVNGGPYLVLPLLGPTTMRDGVGSGIAVFADPVNVALNQSDLTVWNKREILGAKIINERSELIESGGDAFLQSSLDPYAAARSAYLQRRRSEILNGDENGDTGDGGDMSNGGDMGATDAPPAAQAGTPAAAGDAATTPPADAAAAPAASGEQPSPPASDAAPAQPAPPPSQ